MGRILNLHTAVDRPELRSWQAKHIITRSVTYPLAARARERRISVQAGKFHEIKSKAGGRLTYFAHSVNDEPLFSSSQKKITTG